LADTYARMGIPAGNCGSTNRKEELMNQNTIGELLGTLEKWAEEAEEQLKLAQEAEEETEEAMDSMERTYWEGKTETYASVIALLKGEN